MVDQSTERRCSLLPPALGRKGLPQGVPIPIPAELLWMGPFPPEGAVQVYPWDHIPRLTRWDHPCQVLIHCGKVVLPLPLP